MGYVFPRLTNSIREREKLKHDGNDHLRKTYHNCAKTNNVQAPCFMQNKQANRDSGKALLAQCNFWLPWKTHPVHGTTCFANNDKNKTFPLNQNLTSASYGIYVATCVICHEQYVGQNTNKISTRWSSHRNNWNKPDCKDDDNDEQ